MGTLTVTFASIVLEALPFVALGALLSGLIEVFVPRERVVGLLPRRPLVAMLAAAGLGIVVPVCECAVIPVTRRLVQKGVPFSVAVAYLIAGPIVNPIVAASTAVAYAGDWLMVAARLGTGFGVAIVVAFVLNRVYPRQAALRGGQLGAAEHDCGCGAAAGCDAQSPRTTGLAARLARALEHGADDFLHVAQFLIVGAFVAGLCQTFIPRQDFLALAATSWLSVLAMMGLAVLLNLCSEADAFVAASFRNSLPLSAQLAFLVLGPMLDLKLIAMYLSFVRPRALLLMIGLMVTLVFLVMLGLNRIGWEALA